MNDLIKRSAVTREINDFLGKYAVSDDALYAFSMCFGIIDSVPSVDRWISVEDALPEIGYSVLVTRQTENNTRYVRIASRQDDCWMDNTDKYGKPNPHPVIAWMPMPDAYEPPNNMIGD